MDAKSSGNFVRAFRLIGMMEGISFLVLLGICMPLKYYAGIPEAVKIVGWAHGLLFVLYVGAVVQAKFILHWSFKQVFFAMAASVIPFGPFIVDRQYLKPPAASTIKS